VRGGPLLVQCTPVEFTTRSKKCDIEIEETERFTPPRKRLAALVYRISEAQLQLAAR